MQFVTGPIGLRLEGVRGTQPSTLLALETEFAPAFEPEVKTTGVAAGVVIRLAEAVQAYSRFDTLGGDPVTGGDARSFDLGLLYRIDDNARVGFNWQWKNQPTFNDDEINTRVQVTMSVVF